jgi:enoyl-CoA hydratase/carnithine racemase
MSAKTQFTLKKISKSYWVASFDHVPLNLIDPDTIRELDGLIKTIEADKDLVVVVFDSADPEYYMAHYDVGIDMKLTIDMPPGPTGMHPWPDVLTRLSKLPVVTIASIRGRATAAGSEFVLSCDMRFASREKAILSQVEVGMGAVPGGNPMGRLSRLMGRGRAMEVILAADDFSGDMLEKYNYVNRVLPDAELDSFVDKLARRIAGFEKAAVMEAKRFVDVGTLPPDSEFPAAMAAFFVSAQRPETGARVMALFEKGLQTRGDVEQRLGFYMGEYVKADTARRNVA